MYTDTGRGYRKIHAGFAVAQALQQLRVLL